MEETSVTQSAYMKKYFLKASSIEQPLPSRVSRMSIVKWDGNLHIGFKNAIKPKLQKPYMAKHHKFMFRSSYGF